LKAIFLDASIERTTKICISLLLRTPNEKSLPFETISILGLDEYGELDEVKTKKLVKVFRPSGDGKLNLLEFIRSCDEVYRRFRTFRGMYKVSSRN